ncbi:hypothetical protein D7U70_08915 [Pseudomonas balearica]|nr:hypothetical protein [Stutzerimonas balearica]
MCMEEMRRLEAYRRACAAGLKPALPGDQGASAVGPRRPVALGARAAALIERPLRAASAAQRDARRWASRPRRGGGELGRGSAPRDAVTFVSRSAR